MTTWEIYGYCDGCQHFCVPGAEKCREENQEQEQENTQSDQ